jgi:hypothetical protein
MRNGIQKSGMTAVSTFVMEGAMEAQIQQTQKAQLRREGQGRKSADRPAELMAGLQVFDGRP